MLLRYITFINLFLCLTLSEGEDLRSRKRHYRNANRNGREKINRKREDYEMFDDRESLAHIDVARFIQSPDDTTINHGFEQGRIAVNNYLDDNSIINGDFGKALSRDYDQLESNNIPQVNIYNKNRVPQYVNARSTEHVNEHVIKNILNDVSLDGKLQHDPHAEKKCALKNMKIPFFSHDKVESKKIKKNKKKRLFSFRHPKKSTNITKFTEINYNSNNVKTITNAPQNFRMIKRSYYERLCPACKETFLIHPDLDLNEKRRTANDVIHNSRQHYQTTGHGRVFTENVEELNYSPVKYRNPKIDNKIFNDFTRNRRRKRNSKNKETEKSENNY